jgi:hypothetical protein
VMRIELGGDRPSTDAADVVANAIQHGLAEVRLQRSLTPRLERLQMLKRLEERFLDNVLSVGEVPCPLGEPPPRPPQERRETACEQSVDGRLIARPRALEERARGVRGPCSRKDVPSTVGLTRMLPERSRRVCPSRPALAFPPVEADRGGPGRSGSDYRHRRTT